MSAAATARRVQALEATLLPQTEPTIIVVRFDESQITRLRALADGREWGRQPDEDEAGFVGRARAAMAGTAPVAVLISI
jgi:hypothetical protein